MELQLPAGDPTDLAATGERARRAAEQLTNEGTAVRRIRSVYQPEDDTCRFVFEASIVEGGRPT